jgi:DNA topoisomerase-1
LVEVDGSRSEREAKSRIVEAVKIVAEKLGNTPAVCRACYIHPRVLESYSKRGLRKVWKAAWSPAREEPSGLRQEEAALLRVLETEPAAA